MVHSRMVISVGVYAAIAAGGCGGDAKGPGGGSEGSDPGIPGISGDTAERRLSLRFESSDEVKSVRFHIDRTACGEEAVAESKGWDIEAEMLPFGLAASASPDFAGNAFADAFILLPTGCYDVKGTPMDSAGLVSKRCSSPAAHHVVIADGKTTEILLISQCRNDDRGALDTTLVFNFAPQIDSFDYAPSKYVACGAPAKLCMTASDKDKNALDFTWEGDLAKGVKHVETLNENGSTTSCISISSAVAGRFELTATVYDLMASGQRVEAYLNEHGEKLESRDSLQVPLYVSCPNG